MEVLLVILQAQEKQGQTSHGVVYGDGKSDPPPLFRVVEEWGKEVAVNKRNRDVSPTDGGMPASPRAREG